MFNEPAGYPNPHDKIPVRESFLTKEDRESYQEDEPPEAKRITETEKKEGFIAPLKRRITTTHAEEGPLPHEEFIRGGPHSNRRGAGQADQTPADQEGQRQARQEVMEVPNEAPRYDSAEPRFY